MIPFRPGDRVKMTDRYAKIMMSGKKPPYVVNWPERRGVITSANRSDVFIKWSDRRTLEQYPNGAIELDLKR